MGSQSWVRKVERWGRQNENEWRGGKIRDCIMTVNAWQDTMPRKRESETTSKDLLLEWHHHWMWVHVVLCAFSLSLSLSLFHVSYPVFFSLKARVFLPHFALSVAVCLVISWLWEQDKRLTEAEIDEESQAGRDIHHWLQSSPPLCVLSYSGYHEVCRVWFLCVVSGFFSCCCYYVTLAFWFHRRERTLASLLHYLLPLFLSI